MKILLVEDDTLLGDGLRASLTKAGFEVTWVKDGKAALALVSAAEFAVVVLDIGLPVMDGMEVLCEIRRTNSTLPVMMLTARDTTRDKVTCLDHGADDFLIKTVDMEELIARLRALIRRARRDNTVGSTLIIVGELTLDPVTRKITKNDHTVTVSSRELTLMRTLMESAGRVLTRSQLETSVYGWGRDVDSNAIEVHIHNLRLKFGADVIKTVRGVGYTLLSSKA
jgi:two-component system OmpR family response regulator/two-component system response regulator QseB